MRLLRALAPYLFSAALWALAMGLASRFLGPALAPSPLRILSAMLGLSLSGELWREMGLTVARGLCGIILANLCGIVLGLAAGRLSWSLRYVSPLISGLQACPPVVWVSLVMVWAGTGSLVPVATVFAATLPFVFSTTAQGVMGLDRRILCMSKLYEVPALRLWRSFALPAILPFFLAGLSTVLSTGWKAAAVAEFLGSRDGVGAKIYWCYSKMELEALNAWALALLVLGLTLEAAVITPLRRKASQMEARGKA